MRNPLNKKYFHKYIGRVFKTGWEIIESRPLSPSPQSSGPHSCLHPTHILYLAGYFWEMHRFGLRKNHIIQESCPSFCSGNLPDQVGLPFLIQLRAGPPPTHTLPRACTCEHKIFPAIQYRVASCFSA